MVTLLMAAALFKADIPPELYAYLSKKDGSFRYEVKDESKGLIEMTSQTWQGIPWKHKIIWKQPSKIQTRGTAIVYITGDGPFAGDYLDLTLITAATGMPTAMLFDIPNQPLYGKKEDGLIAYTFEKYLQTKDPNWPLLFPMTKSAIRAMDAIEDFTKNSANPIHRFVVTGASKRGWTTWFVGASKDPRVRGIAPMVIDNLNVTKQMKHQLDTWGAYSEEIQDYTKSGLQAKLETPDGKRLGKIVDPYSYRANIKVPTLIVKGANDPYWTADALSQYWDDLKQPKWVVTVPNAGHDLGSKVQAIESIGAFARSIAGDFPMPKQKWSITEMTGPDQNAPLGMRTFAADRHNLRVKLSTEGPAFVKMSLWVAQSNTLDFRKSKYEAIGTLTSNDSRTKVTDGFVLTGLDNKNLAVFGEARYKVGTREFSFCSPTQIFKMKK